MIPNENTVLDENRVMDVRPIPCSIKHNLILKTWHSLKPGEHFVLLNDHDPVPLRYQFQAEFPEAFSWDYLERGPDFRVRITKLKPTAADHQYQSASIYGCSADHQGKNA